MSTLQRAQKFLKVVAEVIDLQEWKKREEEDKQKEAPPHPKAPRNLDFPFFENPKWNEELVQEGLVPECGDIKQAPLSIVSAAQTAVRIAQSLVKEIDRPPEAVELLQEALKAEFQQWDLYYAYKMELRGKEREPIAEHFAEHAEDEAEHIDILQRYLVTMGIQPTKQREKIPSIEYASMEEIIALQYKYEMKAVKVYRQIIDLLDDTDPLKIEIENIIAKEMEHAHDLKLLFE